ncbi:MAG: penicillin-binding transpeptidase domain-containing protein [Holophaga sp.]
MAFINILSSPHPPRRLLGRPEPQDLLVARLPWILGSMLFWVVLILLRLVWLQVVEHGYYRTRAEHQHTVVVPIEPIRGELRDRRGGSLAISLKVESLFCTPPSFYPDYRAGKMEGDRPWGEPDKEAAAKVAAQVAPILELPRAVVLEKLLRRKPFVWIQRQLPANKASAVKALKLDGVDFLPESMREYPRGSLACQLLGFTNIDGVGQLGIEKTFDEQLSGKPGELVAPRDAKGRLLILEENFSKIPVNGSTLQLTLDSTIQHLVEDALEEAMQWAKPATAYAVVVDPNTGEILAMAGTPSFDPNHVVPRKFLVRPESEWSAADREEYRQYLERQKAARKVHPVEDVYEPGSTMKIFTASMALEEHKVHLGETINTENGHWLHNGATITDDHHYGSLTFEEVLWHSSNIGAAKIGTRLDPAVHYQYLRKFGFGELTGLNFPGESAGRLLSPDRWSGTTQQTMCYGYGLSVTPLQILMAGCALANGGRLMQPQGGHHQRHREAGQAGRQRGSLRQDRHGAQAHQRPLRSQAPLRVLHGLLPGGQAPVRDPVHAGRPGRGRGGRPGGRAAVQEGGRRHHALPPLGPGQRGRGGPEAGAAGLARQRERRGGGARGDRPGAGPEGPHPEGRHPPGDPGRGRAPGGRPGGRGRRRVPGPVPGPARGSAAGAPGAGADQGGVRGAPVRALIRRMFFVERDDEVR